MKREIWSAFAAAAVLATSACSQVDDLVDDVAGDDEPSAVESSLPTEAAAAETRAEIDLMRDENGEIRETVFCSPKDASRQLATVAADQIGAPDPRDDLEDFAGAGEGVLTDIPFLWCEWDYYDDPISGVESIGVSSGPIDAPIEDYLVDIFSIEGESPVLVDTEVVGAGHGGEVTWSCAPPVDDLVAVCELDWTDGTFVVSIYFVGDAATQLDGAAMSEPFLAEVPAFVEAAATVIE